MVTKGTQILAFKRGSYNRSEEFLRGVQCVGFGGHVIVSDFNLFHSNDYGIKQSAARELAEELKLPVTDFQRTFRGKDLETIGLLNDDSSPNGQRHFAFLFRYKTSEDPAWKQPQRNEKSVTQIRWLNPMVSPPNLWDFEYWSQLCLLKFYRRAEITKSTFLVRRRRPLKPPHILAVIGSVGSGKSETTRVLKSNFGYSEVNSGKVLAEELGIRSVSENNRESFQNLSFKYIAEEGGPSRLARAIWNKVCQYHSERIVVDGIRHLKTLHELRQLSKPRPVGVFFVHTPAHIAFEFYKRRAKKPVTIYDFLRVRNNPVEAEVERMISIADAVLYHWKGLHYYRKVIHEMMRKIGVN